MAETLHFLAGAVYAQGDKTRAIAMLQECLAVQRDQGYKHQIAESFERFAMLAAEQQQQPKGAWRAARLLGAADGLRAAVNEPLPQRERADYEHTVVAAQAQLDQATFTAAWAEGCTMLLEQAIAAALESVALSTNGCELPPTV